MASVVDWVRRHRGQIIAVSAAVFSVTMLYAFYHTIRRSVDQRHATAWMAVQTVATIAAFAAAAIYARIAYRQTRAIVRQTALAEKDYIERHKPIVLLDRWEHPEKEGNYYYVIRNVGGGFALNVYYFEREDDKAVALGGLAAGVERRLPAEGNQHLVDANIHGKRVVLLAEGPYSRTTQWTPTLNFRTPTNDDRAGHVQHGSIDPKSVIEPPRFEHQSLDTYLANNRAELVRQLEALV